MIKRILSDKLITLSKKFPIVSVIGPRQSGKTTLVNAAFPGKDYANLEEPDTRLFAQKDPRAFLSNHKNGLIIDEVQRVPELFSYIQSIADGQKSAGQFILTGSQHFLLHENISQTLAGRVAILTLLPFSTEEIYPFKKKIDYSYYLLRGFYPPIYDRNIEATDWHPNYVRTYIERDVRLLKNITDLNTFNQFVKMCAGRVGQLLNLSSLANEIGISINTAKAWISVLEASFIAFRLIPYYKNFNKRLVKMPKLYFYDTGLASFLLGIQNEKQLETHYLIGSLFENFVIAEIVKYHCNRGLSPNLFFWRDKLGREIDCIVDTGKKIITLEIKSGKTITEDFFKGLNYWNDISNGISFPFIVYGGSAQQKRTNATVLPWNKLLEIFSLPSNKTITKK